MLPESSNPIVEWTKLNVAMQDLPLCFPCATPLAMLIWYKEPIDLSDIKT